MCLDADVLLIIYSSMACNYVYVYMYKAYKQGRRKWLFSHGYISLTISIEAQIVDLFVNKSYLE